MEPLVSVIVPVYKVEQYLHRCVDSIIGQTYQNLEIILVDDGSPDNCGKICDDYAAKDARIRVIHQKNAGVSAARNAALKAATGEYLMFVDSDDYIPLDAVQIFYERMLQDGSDMAIGKYTEVWEDGSYSDERCGWMTDAVYTGMQVLEKMGDENRFSVGICAKMCSKEIFQNLSYPSLICGEDLWVFPLLVEKCRRISVVAQNTYYYYQRSSSVMHVYSNAAVRDHLEAILFMTQKLCSHGLYSVAATEWYRTGVLLSFWLNEAKEARRLHKQYIGVKSSLRLLWLQKELKTWILWVSMYLPFVKAAVRWKVNSNKQRREMQENK